MFIIRPFFLYFYNMHYFDRHFFNFSIHSRILFLNKCFPGYIHQNLPPVPHFRTKKHLKTSLLGSIRKNHFKIPHILQKAGSQLKIFLHVPLREISISFRGRNGVLEEDFFLCTPQHSPTNITTLLCPIRSTICCPQLMLLSCYTQLTLLSCYTQRMPLSTVAPLSSQK